MPWACMLPTTDRGTHSLTGPLLLGARRWLVINTLENVSATHRHRLLLVLFALLVVLARTLPQAIYVVVVVLFGLKWGIKPSPLPILLYMFCYCAYLGSKCMRLLL